MLNIIVITRLSVEDIELHNYTQVAKGQPRDVFYFFQKNLNQFLYEKLEILNFKQMRFIYIPYFVNISIFLYIMFFPP